MTTPDPCPRLPALGYSCGACRNLARMLARKAEVDAGSPLYRDTIVADLATALASVEENHRAYTTDPYYTRTARPRRRR